MRIYKENMQVIKLMAVIPNLIVFFFLVAIVFFLIDSATHFTAFDTIPLWFWVGSALLLCIALDRLLYGMINLATLSSNQMDFPELRLDYAFVKVMGFLFLGLIPVVSYLLYQYFDSALFINHLHIKSLTLPVGLLVLTMIFYFTLGKFFITRLGRLAFQGVYPTCQLKENGLLIDFYNQYNHTKQRVTIDFNELNSIVLYEPQHAHAFYSFLLSPWYSSKRLRHSSLSAKNAREQADYKSGKINRPSVYLGSPGDKRSLLLKGPNLFYFITFTPDSPFALIALFNKYLKLEQA